jgi:dephospho-CoA kinase
VILVGLTGGIGSGKSTVSAALARRGAVVIDADEITKELQRSGQSVFAAMVERFGADVVGPDGELDRAAIAAVVFNDAEALADLNRIVHPAVGAEIARRVAEQSASDHVVILDVPLMAEVGAKSRYQASAVVVVDTPDETAVHRLVTRRGLSETDARARMARQASREQRLSIADRVIDNGGDLEHLEAQLDEVWSWILSLAPWVPAGDEH